MKKKRFSVEQIPAVLQQAEAGTPIGDLCRQVGISEQTFYRWKKSYGSMLPSEARELKQLREENARLKRVVDCSCCCSAKTGRSGRSGAIAFTPRRG